MIIFLCAPVRISISTYILTSIVIYLPYRLTSSDATRRCVFVYVGKLVGWKTSTFLFNVYKRFLYFCHVFYVFWRFFYFFLERFLHLCFVFIYTSTAGWDNCRNIEAKLSSPATTTITTTTTTTTATSCTNKKQHFCNLAARKRVLVRVRDVILQTGRCLSHVTRCG